MTSSPIQTRFAVIGDPIEHSLSPLIHNYWIEHAGLCERYEAVRIPDGSFAEGLQALRNEGFVGVNVTLPHKLAALDAASETTHRAQRIGAANTLIRSVDGWSADNTDAPGFEADLRRVGVDNLSGRRVALIGAGGAARAAAFALLSASASVTVVNRTPERADRLLRELGFDRSNDDAVALDGLNEAIDRADLVVNAASAGHTGGRLSLPEGFGRLFYDLSYGSAAEDALANARSMNWLAVDGLGMLVSQAALAFEIWFGLSPDTDGALGRCRDALKGRL